MIVLSGNIRFKNGRTKTKAIELLGARISGFEKVIKNKVKVKLHQYEFDALLPYYLI